MILSTPASQPSTQEGGFSFTHLSRRAQVLRTLGLRGIVIELDAEIENQDESRKEIKVDED